MIKTTDRNEIILVIIIMFQKIFDLIVGTGQNKEIRLRTHVKPTI